MGKEQELLQAVKDQDVGSVEKLLVKYRSSKKIVGSAKRLNTNQQDADGMSVLHHAALLGSVDILRLLLDHGALVDMIDNKGLQPLHYAAWQGHIRPTEMLLQQKASVDKPAFDGNTPLHLACEHGHLDVVKRLLERGADPCRVNSQHRMPLDLACEFGCTSVVEQLLESESCRAALRDTSNDTADNNRTTCLHLAARNGHTDTIRLLLEAGIDINRTTLQGTCLHEAAKYGKNDVVRLLLSHGIDVSRLNSYEQTALEVVNKFTMTRAAKELKQMLREALSDIRVQPMCEHSVGSDCQGTTNVFKEDSFQITDQGCGPAGMRKSHRNGVDYCSTGRTAFFPSDFNRAVDSTFHKRKFGNSSHRNQSASQPSPIELSHPGESAGVDGGAPSPQSSLGRIKFSSHELGANGGLLAHVLAQRSTGLQTGSSSDRQSPVPLNSSQPLRNGIHSSASDNGSNRASGGSSESGSYHSVASHLSDNCQKRLSGQSYESGVSDISSSRRSCHSSGSSQGSLNHLEESGYSSTVNVHELLQQGLSDVDILRTWLSSLHLEELTNLFVNAGYDMPTITRMTPEDLTAIGITKPSMRKKLKSEIGKLSINDGIPDYRPKDLSDWLSSLHLDEYHETLVKQGFGTLDTVTDITWEDLEEIGIKRLGHQKKMMLAIDRLKRINTILHRLSGSSQSSNEGLNHFDSSVSTGGKLQSRVLSSALSTSSSSSPSIVSASFVSALPQCHPIPCETSMSRKANTRDNGGILNDRTVVESYGSKGQSSLVEIHPMPLSKLPAALPLSNITSIDHNTYPALLVGSSRNDPVDQLLVGDTTDSFENTGGLDGDATPTNERKLLGSVDGNKGYTRINYAQEEPMDFYKADQQNIRLNALSSYSTLPKKVSAKRKVTDVNDSNGLGLPGFLNFEAVLSSKKTNCGPSQRLSFEKSGFQPASNKLKKEPPPPPKRSDSFKSNILNASFRNRDRLHLQNSNSSTSSHLFSNISSGTSGNLNGVFTNNCGDNENGAVASSGTSQTSTDLSCCENKQALGSQDDTLRQQWTNSETFEESANNRSDNWQDDRLSESSDDLDSVLEGRHSASSASLESNGSGGGVESNTLPFANENVGTIKQRNSSSKPSILTSVNGDGNGLNRSLFENETELLKCKIRANNEKLDNVKTQSSQFTLVNGEIINGALVNNGNPPYGEDTDDVFNDIDGMLNGLTQELDEMLKFHG